MNPPSASPSSDAAPGPDAPDARLARMRRVRARMDELGVDALLLSHGADLPWLTGYRAMPLERPTLLVLPYHGEPVLLVPALEAARVPPAHGAEGAVHAEPRFELRPWEEDEDPVALACALLRATAGSHPTLAVSDRAWATTLLALQDRLPQARWVRASQVTAPLRAVKDAAEIDVLRRAGQAADRVAAALQSGSIALLGRTEAEVSEELAARLLAEGHRRVNFAIVGSGPNGASPHHDAGARRIVPGDVVVCDFGGEFPPGPVDPSDPSAPTSAGYCSDITRTVVTGEPDTEVVESYEVLRAAQQAAVDAVAPGVPAADVDAAARRVIVEAGLGDHFIHRTGHGIGMEEHEDPYVVAGNMAPLEIGHAFSVEPGIYMPGRFGMRLEDIVVVGEHGAERLNTADRSLVVVEA